MAPLLHFLTPRSIGQRFAIATGAGAGLIMIVLSLANYYSSRELLLTQTSREALMEVRGEVGNWDDLVDRIAMLPAVIGATEVSVKNNEGVTAPWLASLLDHSPGRAVYGLYMAREGRNWKDPLSDIWVDRKNWPHGALLKYDFHDSNQDWYRGAKEKKKGIHVTLPYFDDGGSDIDMISITKSVHDASGKFIGVAGTDVAMKEMEKNIGQMRLRDVGTDLFGNAEGIDSAASPQPAQDSDRQAAYLISKTGAVIVGPEKNGIRRFPKPGEKDPEKILGSLADHGLQLSPEHLAEILAHNSGWLRIGEHGDKMVCWAQSRTTGWKLVLTVPYSLILLPARNLALESLLLGGAGLALLLMAVFYASRKVAGPIKQLQAVTSDFSHGSYEKGAGVLALIGQRTDELGEFASGFSAMAREIRLREERLSEWNANLEKTVKERTADLARAIEKVERSNKAMAADLAEAASYARAVLPPKLSAPVATDWIFETSSQLGGDSFGYRWIDDDHLALYLLDVCGHGVGAALLSVSVVNVLRTGSLAGADFLNPSSVMECLNRSFPMERHNDMYFTAWYGVYSLSSRAIRFACGGHPPAVLVTPDGTVTPLPAKGPIVGAFPRALYETRSAEVAPGSRLYLFSDGTYEIDRPGEAMMTPEEFSNILGKPAKGSKLESVLAEIRRQQQSDDFADDFSLLEFRFPAGKVIPDPIARLTLKADQAEIRKLHAFLGDYCVGQALPEGIVFDFEVILEELFTNVIKYGGVKPGMECCTVELLHAENALTLRFTDNGVPFNPLDREEVDTGKPIGERPIGGLGIHFIKKLTDSCRYERKEETNILILVKKLTN
jgi:serine phosphatase RsbU (regulator of sigma subunit)/anti-sigma regulatory factor (Ser/Thr protein kinase)